MMPNYLHHHKDFKNLILIVSEERGIDPILVEKDYWIMHCLFALKQAGYMFSQFCFHNDGELTNIPNVLLNAGIINESDLSIACSKKRVL